ncbi:hypothetical protein DM02DRAFT_514960 [Periconia macrospinosa]|uniref:Uncharacterized protein n=1 Tax=Periconia macrospinosa TaxID=97972 RepID=A0A2V1E9L7_9PLEO|nr:hypothetical protein DM02DRAFT_514960 [Periconia macrospinosa]
MVLPKLRYFSDDFRMSTWLLIGACIQALLTLAAPPRVAIAPAFVLVFSRIFAFLIVRLGFLPDRSSQHVWLGKSSAQIPRPDGSFSQNPSEQEIVVFILGAQSNHVQGRLAPGFREIGEAFTDMWRDLSKNREINGFLGKTSTLFATDQDSDNTAAWISYQRSTEDLHKWALTPVHRKGQETYFKLQKQNPHLGIMHELYSVPKHRWETIYYNFKPFGLGKLVFQ